MKFLLTFFISAIALNTCKNNSSESSNEIILYLNSAKVDCTGVGAMKCFQIQESETLDPNGWQLFYDYI